MPEPREWADESGCWLEQLSKDCRSLAQVSYFECSMTESLQDSYLEQLVAQGYELLSALEALWPERTVSRAWRT
jgi:hypothetical protein